MKYAGHKVLGATENKKIEPSAQTPKRKKPLAQPATAIDDSTIFSITKPGEKVKNTSTDLFESQYTPQWMLNEAERISGMNPFVGYSMSMNDLGSELQQQYRNFLVMKAFEEEFGN